MGRTPANWAFSLAIALLLVRLLEVDEASFSGAWVDNLLSFLTKTPRCADNVSTHPGDMWDD